MGRVQGCPTRALPRSARKDAFFCGPTALKCCALWDVYLSNTAYRVCEVIFSSGLSHRGLSLNQLRHHHHTPRQLRATLRKKKKGKEQHTCQVKAARERSREIMAGNILARKTTHSGATFLPVLHHILSGRT